VNLVDSCGWLEYLADGPNASFFAKAVEDTDCLVVPTICVYEVFRGLLQQVGRSAALDAVAAMRQAQVVPLTETLAMSAASVGISRKLPMVDSIVLAAALVHKATLWTQDAHVEEVPGVKHVARRQTKYLRLYLNSHHVPQGEREQDREDKEYHDPMDAEAEYLDRKLRIVDRD